MRLLILGLTLAMAASTARAGDAAATADEKFGEATKAREQGNEAKACALFKESLALNPNAIGTILNIALCAEETGKTGSAVRWFTEARDRAREQNLGPQIKAAEEHLAKLVDHVPHLAIAFADPIPPGGKITVDDREVDDKSIGDIVVDPGDVKVIVSAPGRVPYETTVKFEPKGDHQHQAISIPKLGYPMTIKNGRRTAGKVLTLSGGVVFAGGVVIGMIARRNYNRAIGSHCSPVGDVVACDDAQYHDAHAALDLGNVGSVIGVSGLVLAGAGAALWLLSPNREEHQLAIVPTLSPTETGLAAVGHF